MLMKSQQSNWAEINTILFGNPANREFPADYITAIRNRRKITGTPALAILQSEPSIIVDDVNFQITDSDSLLDSSTYLTYFTTTNNGKLVYKIGESGANDQLIVKTQLNVVTETFTITHGS